MILFLKRRKDLTGTVGISCLFYLRCKEVQNTLNGSQFGKFHQQWSTEITLNIDHRFLNNSDRTFHECTLRVRWKDTKGPIYRIEVYTINALYFPEKKNNWLFKIKKKKNKNKNYQHWHSYEIALSSLHIKILLSWQLSPFQPRLHPLSQKP